MLADAVLILMRYPSLSAYMSVGLPAFICKTA